MPSPVHPDLRRIAPLLPRRPFAGPRSLRVVRRLTSLADRRPSDVEVVRVGDVSVRVHRPPSSSRAQPGLVWIHGGGYVLGTAAQDDRVARSYAHATGCVVVVPDYRLAPEHPFPAPLEDCHAALVWLADQAEVDAQRIAIGGASAGGGLAAGLALLARDRGVVAPVLQLLVYPMLDDRTVNRTGIDERHFRLWNNKANRFGWTSYTGQSPGSPDVDPLAVPARHDDLTGVAPAWLGVGTLDLFHDEDLAYAERLRAAGIDAEVEVVDGAFHGFDALRPKAGVSRRFHDAQVRAIERAFSRP